MLRAAEAITHSAQTDIEGQTDHELALADVTTTLHNVLGLNLKSRWVVDLLEIASEEALVVILPLDEPGDLIGEL